MSSDTVLPPTHHSCQYSNPKKCHTVSQLRHLHKAVLSAYYTHSNPHSHPQTRLDKSYSVLKKKIMVLRITETVKFLEKVTGKKCLHTSVGNTFFCIYQKYRQHSKKKHVGQH